MKQWKSIYSESGESKGSLKEGGDLAKERLKAYLKKSLNSIRDGIDNIMFLEDAGYRFDEIDYLQNVAGELKKKVRKELDIIEQTIGEVDRW